MTFRRLLGFALIAGMPGIAGAQFTTFIPPVNKAADSVKAATVVEQKVRQDSVVTAQMTNMKTWVDSAAGIVPTPVTAVDSVGVATTTVATTTVATTTVDSTTFVNGSRAPATASALPLLSMVGLGLLLAGVFVGRRESTPERVRARARNRGA